MVYTKTIIHLSVGESGGYLPPLQWIIEGFGGKRALGFLLKTELCQKRSKFCMQFCLRRSNNVLHVFSLKFASFLRYCVCEKTHFSKAILWGPFVERKTKEAFCFAKPWSQYNTWISYYCFVSTSGWGAVLMRWRSVQFFFLCRSLSPHFSKPKISIYLRVFVIESSFLIAFKGLGWICLLAGIVTSTFGAQSIAYFDNSNSERTS